ncbi:hypothetical protein [Sphingomonas sp.]|uniref:hypothetical protein n=1 Tax=Sphingomonas sp. TaxID=28214 RepID=UPI002DD62F71|nr:hypothetical protein [Sphingomonas sp.]
MIGSIRQAPRTWFWVVAIVLLLWGAMGCYACFQQFRLGAEAMGPASDYDRALYASLPAWYNWIYAVAVGAGFLGSVALLLRSGAARTLYLISLIAVLIQFGWLFATSDIVAAKGAGVVLPFPIFIACVAVFQIWFAGMASRRGWIG